MTVPFPLLIPKTEVLLSSTVITIVLQTALMLSQPTHLIGPPAFFDNSLEEIKAPIREA